MKRIKSNPPEILIVYRVSTSHKPTVSTRLLVQHGLPDCGNRDDHAGVTRYKI